MAVPSQLYGKKVLHILDRSLPSLSGYSIRSKYIIEFQAKMGLCPVVVSSPKYERSQGHEEINGISYYRSYTPAGGLDRLLMGIPFAREQRTMKRLEKKIAEVVDALGIDILHAHSPSLCGIPGLRVAQRKGLPLIYEVRALWEDAAVDRTRFKEGSLKYRISRNVEQRLFRKADAIVCICEGLKREIALRSSGDKVYVTPNGVDTEIFAPRAKAQYLVEKYRLGDRSVVGFIGSFFTFEGLADLIRSVPKIVSRQEKCFFLVVGGGVEETRVKNLARELGVLGSAVVFAGRVPHEQIQDYYSIMDVLVYPRLSKRITELVTPLKPLEAMAMEKAVVASDVGGLKELIKDGETGVLHEASNIDDLAEKIVGLVKDESKRKVIGRNARLQMQTDRNWSEIVPKYLEVYERVLKEKAV